MFIEILFRETQAFFILQSGVQFFLPYHWRWYYVILDDLSSCFMIHMLLRMSYFKSIYLFFGVILSYISPKAFHWECCYLWCLSLIQAFSISFSMKEVFISSLLSNKQLFFVSGRISLQALRCFHKPTTSLFVLLLVFQQLRSTFRLRMPFQVLCDRSWHFLLHSFLSIIYLLFLPSGGVVMLLSSTHLLVLSGSCSFLGLSI